MKISEFQNLIKQLYFTKDKERGLYKTFIWLTEEVGELANLIKAKEIIKENVKDELADIIAWTISLANILDIDIEEALLNKYPHKCPICNSLPCKCDD
ncbi:MAG: MazG nucleotide pyrophosphohydrolase domain-containing protein [Candidatus Thorarchaeota archaeon]